MVETSRGRAPIWIVTGSLPPCVGVGIIVTPAPLSITATRWFHNVHWLRRALRSEYIKVCRWGTKPNGSYRIHLLCD